MCRILFLLSFLSLVGCASALVPENNNPKVKVNQASQLFNVQGRSVGAVTLLKQAIPLAQKQNDKETEADAEFYLAEIYKSPGPNGAELKNPNEAIAHFKNAIRLYDDLKFYKRSAFVSWNASAAYEMASDKTGQCSSLRAAAKSLEKSGANSRDALPPEYGDGSFVKSIRDLLKEKKCR